MITFLIVVGSMTFSSLASFWLTKIRFKSMENNLYRDFALQTDMAESEVRKIDAGDIETLHELKVRKKLLQWMGEKYSQEKLQNRVNSFLSWLGAIPFLIGTIIFGFAVYASFFGKGSAEKVWMFYAGFAVAMVFINALWAELVRLLTGNYPSIPSQFRKFMSMSWDDLKHTEERLIREGQEAAEAERKSREWHDAGCPMDAYPE